MLREKAEREQREHERLLVEIDSSNAGIRASAASRLEVTGEDLRQLELLLSHDPDARVRAAAAERLAFADAAAVPAMLLAALHDPDPGVVIASIEALTFVGDDSIIPDLRKMLDHADPAVRSHAQQAIDFLR